MSASLALAADAVVVVHFAYVAFIVVGQLAILVGAAFRWEWIRNRWFRLAHLAAIVVVACEAVLGVVCPLTDLEFWLRERAGQGAHAGSFIGRLTQRLLFYDCPESAFTVSYVLFAGLVLVSLFAIPPRWRVSPPAAPCRTT